MLALTNGSVILLIFCGSGISDGFAFAPYRGAGDLLSLPETQIYPTKNRLAHTKRFCFSGCLCAYQSRIN